MSHSDDVLDNWEELDEACLSSSLQKFGNETKRYCNSSARSGLSFDHFNNVSNPINGINSNFNAVNMRECTMQNNVKSVAVNTDSTKSPLNNMAATLNPVLMVLHKTDDEYQSVNYVPPINSQTVKILRRPAQSLEPRNNTARPKQPIKSLQQREQEYAEARLRILGSAKNPDDDQGASKTFGSHVPTTGTPTVKVNASLKQTNGHNGYNNHFYNSSPHHHNNHNQQYFPQKPPAYNNRPGPMQHPNASAKQWPQPATSDSVSSLNFRNNYQNDVVVRLPRGPDGSSGFQMRR
ncbi:uncharacterized protein DDB_G0281497 [Teleopsis dalmanni]|uniref:uncharacterized protein DDB_G0281497 n=1 Tax=Teleopsis dalmanni TaxID=139649 RepID=UPI0018CF84A9|nr:uncharacterized protein DDB_G0281497 [Teleopsis dalmanni]